MVYTVGDLNQPAGELRDAARRVYDEIRSDTNLSADGRLAALAAQYAKYQKLCDDLFRRWSEPTIERRKLLERQLFRASADSEDAGVAISSRDAADRAAQLEGPDDAARLVDRAVLSGDRVLVRAVAQEAMRRGWSVRCVAAGEALLPKLVEMFEELASLPVSGGRNWNMLRATVGAQPPVEVARYSATELAELAAKAPSNWAR